MLAGNRQGLGSVRQVPKLKSFLAIAAIASLTPAAFAQTVINGNYLQTFDDIGTSNGAGGWVGTLPAGWHGFIGATSSSNGADGTYSNVRVPRGSGITAFHNFASVDQITASSDTAAQQAVNDRVFGVRVFSGNYDQGASLAFNFSTLNVAVSEISLDLQVVNAGALGAVWSIQYGLGANPGSWVTMGIWDSLAGTANDLTITPFDYSDFNGALDNQSNVWFRVVNLSGSTGTGSGRDNIGINNFSITADAVPEPQAYALLACGGLAVCLAARRKRKTA